MLIFGFFMVLMMIWRPRGLIVTRQPSVFLKRSASQLSPPRKRRGTDERRANIVLRVEHLTMRFGGLVAVEDLSFNRRARRRSPALIGPNGGRQDHRIQLHHQLLQRERGAHRPHPRR